MENASKALIMAAEILLGIMLISIGAYLFNMFGNYSRDTTSKIEEAKLAQFNNQFLKYEGERTNDEGQIEAIKCTIHDVASLVNLAKKNNSEYELTDELENSNYVRIDLGGIKNLEKKSESYLVKLIKENDIIVGNDSLGVTVAKPKYYRCTCHINNITGRVFWVEFEDY